MSPPRPKSILDQMTRDFPRAWQVLEHMRAARGAPLPRWPDWCWVPMAGAYAAVCDDLERDRLDLTQAPLVSQLAALGTWRITQGIYQFDPELEQALLETPLAGDIPGDVLKRMPEWCVYVETPHLRTDTLRVHGFFAHLEWDANDAREELRLLVDAETNAGAVPIPIPIHLGGSLLEGVQAFMAVGGRELWARGVPVGVYPDMVSQVAVLAAPMLSLLLYLCSEAAEIDGPGERAPANPLPTKTKNGPRYFAPPAPTVWDVGVRIGAALRQARQTEQTDQGDARPHARPRPHIRRAHWHTYLTGPGRTVPQLRWIHPVLVGSAEGIIPTIHEVE